VPGNSGEIEFEAFMALMAKKIKESEIQDELQETFKTFDRGNKGYYDLDDLRAMVFSYGEKISDEEIVKMFEEQDMNKNGKITFDEFVSIIRAKY
jgi:Ca2+-binding EF-hand superfamily protein